MYALTDIYNVSIRQRRIKVIPPVMAYHLRFLLKKSSYCGCNVYMGGAAQRSVFQIIRQARARTGGNVGTLLVSDSGVTKNVAPPARAAYFKLLRSFYLFIKHRKLQLHTKQTGHLIAKYDL